MATESFDRFTLDATGGAFGADSLSAASGTEAFGVVDAAAMPTFADAAQPHRLGDVPGMQLSDIPPPIPSPAHLVAGLTQPPPVPPTLAARQYRTSRPAVYPMPGLPPGAAVTVTPPRVRRQYPAPAGSPAGSPPQLPPRLLAHVGPPAVKRSKPAALKGRAGAGCWWIYLLLAGAAFLFSFIKSSGR